MAKAKSLKEIVPTNKELSDKAKRVLKETNWATFKHDAQEVIDEILNYRDQYIDKYISELFNSQSQCLPVDIYYSNDDNIDELGILVLNIMQKHIKGPIK